MVDQKVIAISLILIVAIPIMLGYALAFGETDHEAWDSNEKTDITDLLAKTSMPRMSRYTGPNNNGTIIYDYMIDVGGGHYSNFNEPGVVSWLSAGSKPTSQPAYSFTTDSVASTTTDIYAIYAANGILDENNWPAGLMSSNIRIEGTNGETLHFTSYDGSTTWESDVFEGTSTNIKSYLFDNQTPPNGRYRDFYSSTYTAANTIDVTDFTVTAPAGTTFRIMVREVEPFNGSVLYPNLQGEMGFRLYRGDVLCYRVYDDQGVVVPTVWTIENTSNDPIYLTQVLMDDGTINLIGTTGQMENTNIAQIGIAVGLGTGGVEVYLRDYDPITYADVTRGWTLSSYYEQQGYVDIEGIWQNGYRNSLVNMAVYLQDHTEVIINATGDVRDDIAVRRTGDNIFINDENLGEYSSVWISFDTEKMTASFSGFITSNGSFLPEYGKTPNLINTITEDLHDYYHDTFGSAFFITQISLREIGTAGMGHIIYRVDETYSQVGYYQAILNATLNPNDYWPNKSVSFQLTSIQKYGEWIQFGGSFFLVDENNKITVNDKTLSLRDAVFTCSYSSEDQRWYNTINGLILPSDDGSAASSLKFRGEWVMNITKYTLTKTTWTSYEWQPGVFAFNGLDNSFALLGLLTSAAVFIALGLYGRRSGAKVGTLMLVCGACGAVFLCLIV